MQKKARHTGSANFYYDKNNYALHDLSGEFMSDPYGSNSGSVLDSLFQPGAETLRDIARYRLGRELRSHGENWSANMLYSLWWIPFQEKGVNDMFFFDLTGSYDKHTSHTFDNYKLEYLNNTADLPADNRNRYITKPSRHYNYNGKLAYFMDFGTPGLPPLTGIHRTTAAGGTTSTGSTSSRAREPTRNILSERCPLRPQTCNKLSTFKTANIPSCGDAAPDRPEGGIPQQEGKPHHCGRQSGRTH